MRHRHGLRKLNVKSAHRRAMLSALANALIEHEAIRTTLPKAKELRRVIEPLVTLARKPTIANRRLAFARLRNRASVAKLFDELGPRYAQRPGGYVRVLKNGFRAGDAAPMAYMAFVVDQSEMIDEDDEQEERREEVAASEEGGEEAQDKAEAEDKQEAKAEDAAAASEAEAESQAGADKGDDQQPAAADAESAADKDTSDDKQQEQKPA